MYCLPSSRNEVGGARMPELVGNSQSSLPVRAPNACSLRSAVPPLKTTPPPVTSMDPQFGDRGQLCVHTFWPVPTVHARTSPKRSRPGAAKAPPPRTPTYARPGEYVASTPSLDPQMLLLAGM